MRLIGNINWLVFGGLYMALAWWFPFAQKGSDAVAGGFVSSLANGAGLTYCMITPLVLGVMIRPVLNQVGQLHSMEHAALATDAGQALAFLAGANSIFTGDKLLTTPNAGDNRDAALFARLGIVPLEGDQPMRPREAAE